MSTIILNVVIILGIIIAGGFLIFFVGDLLMSIIDPNGDERKIKAKRKKDVEEFNEKIKDMSPEDVKKIKNRPEVAKILALAEDDEKEEKGESLGESVKNPVYLDENTGAMVEDYEVDKPQDQDENLTEKEEDIEEDKESPFHPLKDEEVESDSDRRIREAREALERRKAEILKRLQMIDEDEDAEEEETEEEEKQEEQDTEEETQEIEETKEEIDEDLFEEEIVDEKVEEETNEVKENELAEARRALDEEKARYATLIKEIQAREQQAEKDKKTMIGSKSEYEQKLAEKEKALEINEKELRACSKEYKPLVKVKNTLDKDEKKLRIKEAQVAKQKVLLYGVNNYSDLDEEKAKKLSEELDLLEGLKLSVQHCREVMASNKERMPILEKMFNILSKQNAELKADVEYLKEIISKFED